MYTCTEGLPELGQEREYPVSQHLSNQEPLFFLTFCHRGSGIYERCTLDAPSPTSVVLIASFFQALSCDWSSVYLFSDLHQIRPKIMFLA